MTSPSSCNSSTGATLAGRGVGSLGLSPNSRNFGSGGRSGAPLGMRVQRLRRNIGLIRPDNRARLGVRTQLSEKVQIPKRLEDPPVIKEIRQIDLCGQAVVETNID